MWTAKGILLGSWLFSFGNIAYALSFFRTFNRHSQGASIEFLSLKLLTLSNPVWWLALIACLALGLAIARVWRGRRILWIVLVVTELIPIGFLALILVLASKY